MKNTIIAAVLMFSVIGPIKAGGFALIDLKAPETSVGTFFAAASGLSSSGGLVAVVTHKQGGITWMDSLISGWVPLAAGGTIGGSLGKASISLGSGVNLLPVAKASLLGVVNSLSASGQLPGLKAALAPNVSNATVFIGPAESLVFDSFQKYGTRLTWFVGASFKWN